MQDLPQGDAAAEVHSGVQECRIGSSSGRLGFDCERHPRRAKTCALENSARRTEVCGHHVDHDLREHQS